MTTKIEPRADVNPRDGEREYGEVRFADPINSLFPLDTDDHIRASWRNINAPGTASKYDHDALDLIRQRIRKAAQVRGIELGADAAG